jgi:heavy metal-binding protein
VTLVSLVLTRRDLLVTTLQIAGLSRAGRALGAAPDRPLPPISYTCPMHAEVVDNRAGACPICKMTLVPIRLDSVWSCSLHPDVTSLAPGRCPQCRRDLVKVIKGLSFTCRVHPKVDVINPGACPICKRPLVAKYSLRPHGDHNPKHGGQFFMAPNNWHIEGTHPAPGVIRLFVYDDYSRPTVSPTFSGRIISITPTGRDGRPGTPTTVDMPFQAAPRRPYLEARAPQLGLPAIIAVKVRFKPDEPETRFDFFFLEYSKEPVR